MFTISDFEYVQDLDTVKSLTDTVNKHSFYSEKMHYVYDMSTDENWNLLVDSIEFNLELELNKSLTLIEEKFDFKTFVKFEEAVKSYLKEKTNNKNMKAISIKSLKNFLYLLPIFEKYLPSISIDADTGYVNSTFTTRDNGLFTALTTAKSEIHYSRVSKGVKIYKFSGVAKIKDTRDFKHFEKVLEML